jgi:ABC-type cobalamin transport system ATPase subunit
MGRILHIMGTAGAGKSRLVVAAIVPFFIREPARALAQETAAKHIR